MNITDLKVYTPAKDFEASKRFYSDLGFQLEEAWGGNVDCTLGGASFRLQDFYVKDWADNFMMRFEVDDVHTWYEHAKNVIETGKHDARIAEPEMNGDTTICHIWDPSGILLIFLC
jgi:catechol 2,3-dioxygenase-like lactoylglutathione lyase family enzyme